MRSGARMRPGRVCKLRDMLKAYHAEWTDRQMNTVNELRSASMALWLDRRQVTVRHKRSDLVPGVGFFDPDDGTVFAYPGNRETLSPVPPEVCVRGDPTEHNPAGGQHVEMGECVSGL
jgi:hypothetical protein